MVSERTFATGVVATPSVRPRGDHAVLLDGGILVAALALASMARTELPVMYAGLAVLWAARLVLYTRLPPAERPRSWLRELSLLVGCAVLGYANDWNTVVRHGVYAYAPPSDLSPWSSIPGWMIGFWGLILRFVITLGAWERLGETGPREVVRFGRRSFASPWLRVALLLTLVLVTRQAIYRLWNHPIGSWLPFALALAAHASLFPWGPREIRLVLGAVTVGPLAEAILIAAGLHRYAHGWIFGVPLWIVLWWALGALVLAELGALTASGGRRSAPRARAR